MRIPVLVLASLLFAACGSSSAGGRAGSGGPDGGDAGAGGSGGPGGSGGAGEDPGVPVELPFVSFGVRTQVWGPIVYAPGMPSIHLRLGESGGGCDALGNGTIGPGSHALSVLLREPAIGACRLDTEAAAGCRFRAFLQLGEGRGFMVSSVPVAAGDLRVDRLDENGLAGTLRLRFHADHEVLFGTSTYGGRRYLTCMALDGRTRECQRRSSTHDCCNEGKEVVEAEVPFEASFCARAAPCGDGGCAAVDAALACEPPEVDCARTCAALAAGCGSCLDCQGDARCEEWVAADCAAAVAGCPSSCALAAGHPGAAVAVACLAAGAGAAPHCEAWDECLTGCGTFAGGDR